MIICPISSFESCTVTKIMSLSETTTKSSSPHIINSKCKEVVFPSLDIPDHYEILHYFFQTLFMIATSSLVTKQFFIFCVQGQILVYFRFLLQNPSHLFFNTLAIHATSRPAGWHQTLRYTRRENVKFQLDSCPSLWKSFITKFWILFEIFQFKSWP